MGLDIDDFALKQNMGKYILVRDLWSQMFNVLNGQFQSNSFVQWCP